LQPHSDAETKIWDFYGLNRLVNKFQIMNHLSNYKFIEPFSILKVVFLLFLGYISRLFAHFYRISIDSKFEYHFVDLNKLNLNIYILMWFQQLLISKMCKKSSVMGGSVMSHPKTQSHFWLCRLWATKWYIDTLNANVQNYPFSHHSVNQTQKSLWIV